MIKAKPIFLLYEEEYSRSQKGIKAVYQVLIKEKGMTESEVKDLVVRYPVICTKSETDLRNFFKVLQDYGVHKQVAI